MTVYLVQVDSTKLTSILNRAEAELLKPMCQRLSESAVKKSPVFCGSSTSSLSCLPSRTSFYEAGWRIALLSGSSGLAIFRMMHLFLADLPLWCWTVLSVFSKVFACCATEQTRPKQVQEGRHSVSRAVVGRFHITDHSWFYVKTEGWDQGPLAIWVLDWTPPENRAETLLIPKFIKS